MLQHLHTTLETYSVPSKNCCAFVWNSICTTL